MKTLVVLTGGTFESTQGQNGLTASRSIQTDILQKNIISECNLALELTFIQPVCKLSENMDPSDWELIIKTILANIDGQDNVLIIHGTDTLAYTASAIAYIEKLNKRYPIVLTGANLPLESAGTDAVVNTVQSLIALNYFTENDICGTFIVFNGTNNYSHTAIIHPATKVKKDKWEELCYRSFYLDNNSIGIVNGDGNVEFNKDIYIQLKNKETFYPNLDIRFDANKVAMLKVYQGFDPNIIKLLVDNGKQIIALEIYNSGTAPAFDSDFAITDALEYAKAKNAICFALSQHEGKKGATMNIYESSSTLINAGLVPLGNMIWEAVAPKMMLACSNFSNKNDIINFMTTNIAFEIQQDS